MEEFMNYITYLYKYMQSSKCIIIIYGDTKKYTNEFFKYKKP